MVVKAAGTRPAEENCCENERFTAATVSSLLKTLLVPTFDSIGLESKLGFKPAPHAKRAGHSTSWRTSEGIFNRLLAATRRGALPNDPVGDRCRARPPRPKGDGPELPTFSELTLRPEVAQRWPDSVSMSPRR
jgi:hypothetical protein